MEVTLEFSGVMEKYYPRKRQELTLPEGACLSDLFQCIGHLSPALPESVWHFAENRFRGPVLVLSDGGVLRDEDTKLYNGQVIRAMRCLMGG